MLLAFFVGAGLSVVGVTMQALVRNPLADPFILGISSGASVGAVLVILFGIFSFFGVYALCVGAFLGALVAFVVVFFLARRQGRLCSTRLILVGVAVLGYQSRKQRSDTTSVVLVAGGTFGKWTDLILPVLALLVGMGYLLLQTRSLNALLIGEETAQTLGTDTDKFRKQLFLVTSLITGVIVAVSGVIGFVGLMIPHSVRFLVGSDHRRVLPVSLLLGGIFLIWARDVLARVEKNKGC